jgi:hypothetical protein
LHVNNARTNLEEPGVYGDPEFVLSAAGRVNGHDWTPIDANEELRPNGELREVVPAGTRLFRPVVTGSLQKDPHLLIAAALILARMQCELTLDHRRATLRLHQRDGDHDDHHASTGHLPIGVLKWKPTMLLDWKEYQSE